MPRLATGAVIVAALAMPAWAFARGLSPYDRSRDVRDERNAARIFRALRPRAVVWSYWDVRTTLQYEHFVAKMRPDVEIVDHRAYARYQSDDDSAVALALARDRRYAHRPLYVIPGVVGERAEVAALERRVRVKPVLKLGKPSEAVVYNGGGHLYLVERR